MNILRKNKVKIIIIALSFLLILSAVITVLIYKNYKDDVNFKSTELTPETFAKYKVPNTYKIDNVEDALEIGKILLKFYCPEEKIGRRFHYGIVELIMGDEEFWMVYTAYDPPVNYFSRLTSIDSSTYITFRKSNCEIVDISWNRNK